jgi:uncharacterized protein with GYD domain
MPTFVTMLKFTDRGVGAIRDTCKRAAAFKAAAEKLGIQVREQYWTLGPFDGLLIFQAPDDQTATAALLHLDALDNVHTQTARAFDAAEMEQILAKIPR